MTEDGQRAAKPARRRQSTWRAWRATSCLGTMPTVLMHDEGVAKGGFACGVDAEGAQELRRRGGGAMPRTSYQACPRSPAPPTRTRPTCLTNLSILPLRAAYIHIHIPRRGHVVVVCGVGHSLFSPNTHAHTTASRRLVTAQMLRWMPKRDEATAAAEEMSDDTQTQGWREYVRRDNHKRSNHGRLVFFECREPEDRVEQPGMGVIAGL
ncbi:hypothetical protein HMN09_01188400 [Mycena chlorophos]|uniref:Uncharacterized protein n=1 Tax=Mycena chlorophos TaxID=658473 RepID=A0A8H6VZJ8_MYCCL|nr:hypothetical protein HMN09_01188400 [Mycena chlorophos]